MLICGRFITINMSGRSWTRPSGSKKETGKIQIGFSQETGDQVGEGTVPGDGKAVINYLLLDQ